VSFFFSFKHALARELVAKLYKLEQYRMGSKICSRVHRYETLKQQNVVGAVELRAFRISFCLEM
jgi:hypothetical protein